MCTAIVRLPAASPGAAWRGDAAPKARHAGLRQGRALVMRPPAFWQHEPGLVPRLLLTLPSRLAARATARRVARPGWRAGVPVFCCGNAAVGGAGKTTLALALLERLAAHGVAAHAVTRGYGGRVRGVLRVDPACHDAALAGDEAMLLAAQAPCWVSADRAAAARAAVAAGAQAIVMDDGLQNPGLVKDAALLVIDGAAGFGNGHVMPLGPLREPAAAAAARCRAAVLIGADATGALAQLPETLPVLRAHLVQHVPAKLLARPAVAFAGIARPAKFFDGLDAAGVQVVARHPFPDHHPYTTAEIARLVAVARAAGAALVTTPKDAARLSPAQRALLEVAAVGLRWEDEAALDTVIATTTGMPR